MPLPTWAGPQDAAGYEIRNVLLENVNGLPTASAALKGRVVYNSQDDRFWYCTGSAWVNKATDSDMLAGQLAAYYLDLANQQGLLAVSKVSGIQGVINATRIDQLTAPTADVSYGGRKITNLADGTAGGDAATYGQVLAMINNQVFKAAVKAATTGNITLSGLQTVDGVTLTTNDRVLVKDQTTGAANGIYVAGSGAWSRATDADTTAEFASGSIIPVDQGTVNGDKLFMNTTNTGFVLGTNALTITAYGAASGEIGQAGNGISKTGVTYSVTPAPNGGIAVDGTGVKLDRTMTDGVVRGAMISSGLITGASGGDVTVTHGLGTKYPVVKVYDTTASPEREVQVGYGPVSTTTGTISFGATPPNNRYRWVAAG